MTAPAIVEHDVTVHQGHVLDVLPTLPAASVQCCVTSPPYYGLRDYGVDGQLGLEPSPAEYVAGMVAVFAEVRRVLADDGVLWLNLGDSYSGSWGNQSRNETSPGIAPATDGRYPAQTRTGAIRPGQPPAKNLLGIPWRVAFALQDDGWTLRNAVIWAKANCMPESVTDRLSGKYEHVFLFSKSRRYWFDLDAIREPVSATTEARYARPVNLTHHTPGDGRTKRWEREPAPGQRPQNGDRKAADPRGRNPGDVWTLPTQPFPGAHFATMPSELARRCILAGCPDTGTVLDPFAGSGTTLKGARSLGRKSIGVELNPAYIEIIRDRIGQTPLDFGEATA